MQNQPSGIRDNKCQLGVGRAHTIHPGGGFADTHRAIAPLRRAEDAVELDTGALTFEESLHLLLETIRRRAKL